MNRSSNGDGPKLAVLSTKKTRRSVAARARPWRRWPRSCPLRARSSGRTASSEVPMREIALTNGESVRVYDTTGPQGQDLQEGLPRLRQPWIDRRVARGRPQLLPDALRPAGRDHRGDAFRGPARERLARAGARRGGGRTGHHPGQHPPPGAGADDHRPQVPGEDQRQHRQLRHLLVDPGRGGEAPVGHPLGRRHGDGSVDRGQHPRDPGVDPAQRPGADRDGADLPGAGEGQGQGRGPQHRPFPRDADRAGRAGGGLLHHPRGRAAAATSP